jgi:hypothetical protein
VVHGRWGPASRRARQGVFACDRRGELPRRSGAGSVGGRRGSECRGLVDFWGEMVGKSRCVGRIRFELVRVLYSGGFFEGFGFLLRRGFTVLRRTNACVRAIFGSLGLCQTMYVVGSMFVRALSISKYPGFFLVVVLCH